MFHGRIRLEVWVLVSKIRALEKRLRKRFSGKGGLSAACSSWIWSARRIDTGQPGTAFFRPQLFNRFRTVACQNDAAVGAVSTKRRNTEYWNAEVTANEQ